MLFELSLMIVDHLCDFGVVVLFLLRHGRIVVRLNLLHLGLQSCKFGFQ